MISLENKKKTFRAELSDNVSLTALFEFIQPTYDIIRKEKNVPSRTVEQCSLTAWFQCIQPTCDIIRKEKKTFRAELLDNGSLTTWFEFI